MNLIVRMECEADYPAVSGVIQRAFGQSQEADLVAALRHTEPDYISMVGLIDDRIFGHIFFSRVTIEHNPRHIRSLGLAPLAVEPEYQRKGIGSALLDAGLATCRGAGYDAIVVLGHPDFYPRFGFVPASQYQLSCEYEVPDPAFMALELRTGALEGASGLVKYAPAFARLV